MARLLLPAPLREAVGIPAEVTLPGATVGEVLAEAGRRWPEVGEMIVASSGRLALGVSLFIGASDVRRMGGLSAPVASEDRLHVVVPKLIGP